MKTVSFDGRTVTYNYDENGNRKSIDYNGSAEEAYNYDKNNRLLTLTNKRADGSEISSYSYTYDHAGRQISKTDSYGSTSYTYDKAGRILKVEAPGKTTVYSYDGAGNRISQDETYTSEQVLPAIDGTGLGEIQYILKRSEYIYSNAGRLLKLVEKLKDAEGMELLQKITSFRYDNNGNELRRTVEYVSLFNKANPKAYEAAVYGEETTEPIHAVVDQTVSAPEEKAKSITTAGGNTQGTGEPQDNRFVKKIESPGNIFSTTATSMEILAEIGEHKAPDIIRKGKLPNNIGKGMAHKIIEFDAKMAADSLRVVKRGAKYAGYITVPIDVGYGVYENVKDKRNMDQIAADAATDTTLGTTNVTVTSMVGTAVGGPIGTATGFVVGLGLVYVTDLKEFDGRTIKERISEKMYNDVKNPINPFEGDWPYPMH